MKLYRLADLATVWVQAQVYEQDLPFMQLGQEAMVSLASQPDPEVSRARYLYLSHGGRENPHRPRAHGVPQPWLFPQARHVRHGRDGAGISAFGAVGAGHGGACGAARRTPCLWRWTAGILSRGS